MYKGYWQNVMTTYVNRKCDGRVTQDGVQCTIDFAGDSLGFKTFSKADLWTTSHNFEFKNTVWNYSTGKLKIEDVAGARRLCQGGSGEQFVMTKNTGEPFSPVQLKAGF